MKEKKLLLVEDNPQDERLTIRALKQAGLLNEIVVVRDGAEALDYLFAGGPYASHDAGDLPTVVLLDLRLPKVDGHEVLRRIRADERTKLLPVVILTSSDDGGDVLKSYEEGANSYVRKPVNFEEFSKAIKSVGLYWLITNMGPPDAGE